MGMTEHRPRVMDPAQPLRADPVHTLASAVWDKWAPRAYITIAWKDAFGGVADGSVNGYNANYPLRVAALSCSWIG